MITRPFDSQRSRQQYYAGLGDMVRRILGACDDASRRADIDDLAFAPGYHMFSDFAAAVENRAQVGVETFFPLLIADCDKGPRGPSPGIIDKNIYFPEPRERRFHQSAHFDRLAHISPDRQAVAACLPDLGGSLLDLLNGPGGNYDVGAGLSQGDSHSLP
jgi:hypothetical protein